MNSDCVIILRAKDYNTEPKLKPKRVRNIHLRNYKCHPFRTKMRDFLVIKNPPRRYARRDAVL